MTLKNRRQQRILNEIALLEAMDTKLWLQLWGSAIFCLLFIAAIVYSFASAHKDVGWLFIILFIGYIGLIIAIGHSYKTKLWRYSYLPVLAGVILLGVLLGGFNMGFSGTPSDMDGKRGLKRYTMNREDLIQRALAKRYALLEKLKT